MFGISTAWMSDTMKSEKDLFRWMSELGIDFLELEYRMPEALFVKLQPKLKNKVLSIHNFFPFPRDYSHLKPSGDLFLLSSLDQEERKHAVEFTIKTIRTAHELECSAVVLHLGKVPMESTHQQFCHYYDAHLINAPEMDLFFSQVQQERAANQPRSLDAVLFSLEQLNKEAEKRNVSLGVENRYYFHEIPDFEELRVIFQKFAGGNIFFWHDIGHGHVQEQLNMQSHRKLLAAYAPYLLGIHLHDARGYTDHQAPGKGDVDFTWIKEYVKEDTLKVLELHPRESLDEVKAGIDLLQRLGYA